ncbi:hypothetical protein LEMA_uP073100.1 [Plenodomus lingam JN3]|uniref:Uncharacterized protein n=1 Tax=Leptosphaeria maculans (strain JN3 / isolate v23.1.3 / race Av1-4-5-6-7-8) TaxID=985895 RepID=E5A7X6_LEPMJ|nr:hypothetical protein LEMA_uP073100.1 [Plenodomus lingam JN3]CBX99721.1 hypothetical protein LEMA_uP073100.1 [Plenodomus lingam JN3]
MRWFDSSVQMKFRNLPMIAIDCAFAHWIANICDAERRAALRPSCEYLPFDGGPRICLGQQYALTEASYVTVRMLQEFKAM